MKTKNEISLQRYNKLYNELNTEEKILIDELFEKYKAFISDSGPELIKRGPKMKITIKKYEDPNFLIEREIQELEDIYNLANEFSCLIEFGQSLNEVYLVPPEISKDLKIVTCFQEQIDYSYKNENHHTIWRNGQAVLMHEMVMWFYEKGSDLFKSFCQQKLLEIGVAIHNPNTYGDYAMFGGELKK